MSYEVAPKGNVEIVGENSKDDRNLRERIRQGFGRERDVDQELVWYVGDERCRGFEEDVLARLEKVEWFDKDWSALQEVFQPKPIDPEDYKKDYGRDAFVSDKASELAADTAKFELGNGEEPVFYWEMDRRDDGRFYPRIGNTERSWLDQCGIASRRCAMEKLAVWELEQGFVSGKDFGFWLSPEGRGYTDGGLNVYVREGEILRCWSTLQPVDEQVMVDLSGALEGVAAPVREIRRVDDLRVNPYMGNFGENGEEELWDYLEYEAKELGHLWRFMRSGKAEVRTARARADVEGWARMHFDEFVEYDDWREVGSFGVVMEEYFSNQGWEQRTEGGDACSSLYSTRVESENVRWMDDNATRENYVTYQMEKRKMTPTEKAKVVKRAKKNRDVKVPGLIDVDLWKFDGEDPVAKYMVKCPLCHRGLGYVGLHEVECRHCNRAMSWQAFLC